MATTDSLPSISLQHSGHDDDMELSSDHGHYDGDFDIDIDQFDYAGDADADHMQEDLKSDRGTSDMTDLHEGRMNDDEMLEGSIDGREDLQDGVMHDRHATNEAYDEDLEDYLGDEPEYPQEAVTVTESAHTTEHEIETAPQETTEDVDATLQPDDYVTDRGDDNHTTEEISDAVQANEDHFQSNQEGSTSTALDAEKVHPPVSEMTALNKVEDAIPEEGDDLAGATRAADDSLAESNEAQTHNEQATEQHQLYGDDSSVPPLPDHDGHEATALEVEVANEPEDDEPRARTVDPHADEQYDVHLDHTNASTLTGLHPTIVRYEGDEVSLFPSSHPSLQDQYFLENENLVNGSIGDLLQACRAVPGSEISEDEELVLTIEDLGLSLSEDSTPAFSVSFLEILQLYVQLQALDGVEQPPPLYVTLSTKTRFTNRMTILAHAVAEGKGLSTIALVKEMQYHEDEALAEFYDYDEHDEEERVSPVADSQEEETRGSDQVEEGATRDDGVVSAQRDGDDDLNQEENSNHVNAANEHPQVFEHHEGSSTAQAHDEELDAASHDGVPMPSVPEAFSGSQPSVPDSAREPEVSGATSLPSGEDHANHQHPGPTDNERDDIKGSEIAYDQDNEDQTVGASPSATTVDDQAEVPGPHADEINFDDEDEPVEAEVGQPSGNSKERRQSFHDAKDDYALQPETATDMPNEHVDDGKHASASEHDLDEIDFDDDEADNGGVESSTSSLKRSYTEHSAGQGVQSTEQDSKRPRS